MSLIALNRHGGETIYGQISRLLEQEIRNLFKPGDCLPSEGDLAGRFSVNRHTIRRAIEELIESGLVERRHGMGTFVLDGPINYSLGKVTNFTEALESIGKSASSKLIRKLIIPARDGVAERLGVAAESPVIWFETLRMADKHAICLISHFLPLQLFPELYTGYQGGALHQEIKKLGIRIRRQESLISAVLPRGDDASLLGMPLNQPILRVKSVNVNVADGTPVEYALTRFRADRIQLCINP
jgi:GntR family transcriptional regulator, phosphonate transport system regulatory protein